MSELLRMKMILAGCATVLAVAGCGGGGGSDTAAPPPAGSAPPPTLPVTPDPLTPAPPVSQMPPIPGAPVLTGNIALDGREWINFRRTQIGMSVLARNSIVDTAAQRHSDYQSINDTITHVQTPGKPGFTGVELLDRLREAGYVFTIPGARAFGEVIAATSNDSGQYMAEELITAVYHRFVIFEPMFKEIGTGAATTRTGYHYFTTNFTANNGFGPGLAVGQIAVWPFDGQTAVPRNFFSDTESPDPVPPCARAPAPDCGLNEVGYPISVHANINRTVRVTSFSVRPRGGAEMAVKLLSNANDRPRTGPSSAAIVPLRPLAATTVYDVSFTGSLDVVNADGDVLSSSPVSRTWSFTTR